MDVGKLGAYGRRFAGFWLEGLSRYGAALSGYPDQGVVMPSARPLSPDEAMDEELRRMIDRQQADDAYERFVRPFQALGRFATGWFFEKSDDSPAPPDQEQR